MYASTDADTVAAPIVTIQQLFTQLLTGSDLVTATDIIKNSIEAASTSQENYMLAISASATTVTDAAKVMAEATNATSLKAAVPTYMYLHPGAHGADNIINYGLTIVAKICVLCRLLCVV